jgi:hypothetical protein
VLIKLHISIGEFLMTESVENLNNETTNQPTLTIQDVQNALRIIDVAAERGAFRGAELSQVGGVRDRVAAFLETVAAAQAEVAGETEGAVEPQDAAATSVEKQPAKKANRKR